MICARREPPSSRAIRPVRTTAIACANQEKKRKPGSEVPKSSSESRAKEWRDGGIGNVAPGEVAGVVEEREFVAIETVAIAG